MAYNKSNKLPSEKASKLGHINIINSEWIKSLLNDFEYPEFGVTFKEDSKWHDLKFNGDVKKLERIWAVDGSFVKVSSDGFPRRELTFVKTALMNIDLLNLSKIDVESPHPLELKKLMKNSALYHSTVFPLKNIITSRGNNYDSIRNIIYDSIKLSENGNYFETLKWLTYEKWNDKKKNSQKFECPHCHKIIKGLPYNVNEHVCEHCNGHVYLTDMIGFNLEMNEENASESIASSYMMIMEHLMLFTVIRLLWNNPDKNILDDTLFIKDGPLTLRSQYSKLVDPIRDFLEYAKNKNRPIYIIGQEKSGIFKDHIDYISGTEKLIASKNISLDDDLNYSRKKNKKVRYFVLNHKYVRNEVQRAPQLTNPYGSRTNWGEKVYVIVNDDMNFVLNIPPGEYKENKLFPCEKDLIGLERILLTLPNLISYRYDGALFPIELANGIASLSSYPSSDILKKFSLGDC